MEWRASPEPDRRAAALRSAWLDRSTDAYGKGFAEDLNHFYSGLNTLAMLTVELALAAALPAVWSERYFEADDAARELQTRTKRAKQLAQAVDLSINAAKTKLERKNKRDVWTAISEADLRCLTVDAPPQVARAYQAALAGAPDFAVDAARGQLLLYRELGVRTANVDAALRIFPAASAAETCATGAILADTPFHRAHDRRTGSRKTPVPGRVRGDRTPDDQRTQLRKRFRSRRAPVSASRAEHAAAISCSTKYAPNLA